LHPTVTPASAGPILPTKAFQTSPYNSDRLRTVPLLYFAEAPLGPLQKALSWPK